MDRDVMTRVRHLNPVPDPSMPPPEELRERITAQPHEDRRAPRQRRRRTVMAAVALPATAAVAIMAVVAINAHQQTSDPLAALPAARVSYGLDVPVTLRPDPEVSLPEMKERLREALAQRAQQMDAAGITVRDIDDNQVMVRLPGAETDWEALRFLEFPRIQILDANRSILATASTLDGLKKALPRTPGKRTVVYVQRGEGPGQTPESPMRYSTAAAPGVIASLKETRPPRKVHSIEVPADTYVVGNRRDAPNRFLLVRPVPLVPPSQVQRTPTGASGGGPSEVERLTLTIGADVALPEASTDVIAFHIGSMDGPEDDTAVLGRGDVSAAQRSLPISVTPRMPSSSGGRFDAPDVGGQLDLDAATAWGEQPPPSGRSVPGPTAAWAGVGIQPNRWLNVIEPDPSSGRTTSGLAVGVQGTRVVAIGSALPQGEINLHTSNPRGGLCSVGIGAPRAHLCQAESQAQAIPGQGYRLSARVYGRVQPGVSRIAVRRNDGALIDAHIQNGWFLANATWTSETPNFGTKGLRSSPDEVLAWDADGNPVPVIGTR